MVEHSPTQSFEPSSVRPLVAIVVAGLSFYAVLAIVVVVSATNAGARALVWLAVPVLFTLGAAAMLVVSTRAAVRSRLASMSAIFVVESDRP
jgi:hypothetical protein